MGYRFVFVYQALLGVLVIGLVRLTVQLWIMALQIDMEQLINVYVRAILIGITVLEPVF